MPIVISATGYSKRVRRYQADKNDCRDCAFKEFCTTSNCRGIKVNPNYERLKAQARKNLASERGKKLRCRRGFEVETVFGDKKENNHRRRFLMRGRKRVLIESGIYYISHNIRKLYKGIIRKMIKERFEMPLAIEC